jgi:hypothetical protein
MDRLAPLSKLLYWVDDAVFVLTVTVTIVLKAIPQQLKCRLCGSAFRNCRITKLRQPWVNCVSSRVSSSCLVWSEWQKFRLTLYLLLSYSLPTREMEKSSSQMMHFAQSIDRRFHAFHPRFQLQR